MIRSLLLTLVLAGCTVQQAERNDPAQQGRFDAQDIRKVEYRDLRHGHRVIGVADPTIRQFGGQSGEPGPPTDGLDNSPTSPAPPPDAPPTDTDTDPDTILDSDNDGIPDDQDPDFNAGTDTAQPEDTGDTDDTGSD